MRDQFPLGGPRLRGELLLRPGAVSAGCCSGGWAGCLPGGWAGCFPAGFPAGRGIASVSRVAPVVAGA
ncbi:hypothetical protein [Streptomyces sp. NPDC007264]|uniref:hypothetical protein n=1 Tax=Streptomyces sp. NPDC007264 TaxID=3364777 RepID=UPI0036DD10E6